MSYGRKTSTYQPVSKNMLPFIGEHFTNISEKMIGEVFQIMTSKLSTETLLFVAIIDTIDRYVSGQRDAVAFGLGTGIRLSAVSRDKTHKAQTEIMELLHDVVVELPMAGANFEQLQQWLRKNFAAEIVMFHSCGSDLIPTREKEKFFALSGPEQELRTRLDWESETLKHVPEETVLRDYDYLASEAEHARRCFTIALKVVTPAEKKISPVAA